MKELHEVLDRIYYIVLNAEQILTEVQKITESEIWQKLDPESKNRKHAAKFGEHKTSKSLDELF